MQLPTFIKVVLAIALLGFIGLGINQIKHDREVKQIQRIEIKSNESKLIELDNRYNEVLEHKANTEAEKEEQQKRIEELESDRERLERELQAKLDRQAKEQEKLAQAAKKATGTQTASASPVSGCDNVRQLMSAKGFSGAELNAAVELARLESTCSSSAVNKSSGACNIFQEYRCGKWGGLHNTDAHINGAIGYMRASYGSWQNALAKWHSRSPHWW